MYDSSLQLQKISISIIGVPDPLDIRQFNITYLENYSYKVLIGESFNIQLLKLNPLIQQLTLLKLSMNLYNHTTISPFEPTEHYHFNPRNFSLLGTFNQTIFEGAYVNITLFWNQTLSTSSVDTFHQSHIIQIVNEHRSILHATQLSHYILHAICIVLLVAFVVGSQRVEVPILGESLSVGNKYLIQRKRLNYIGNQIDEQGDNEVLTE